MRLERIAPVTSPVNAIRTASKNGSKPKSKDEYEAAYFLRGAALFFAAELRDDVDLEEVDFVVVVLVVEDLVDDADGRDADRELWGRVVPCERLPR
jgi:hypothetical protein